MGWAEALQFGDWALVERSTLSRLLKGVQVPKREVRERHLVRVMRNAFGFPSSAVLYSNNWLPWVEVKFSDDRVTFDAPRWADFLDWSRDLIVCSDRDVASAIERAVFKWHPAERVAVVCLDRVDEPLPAIPGLFSNIWIPILPNHPVPSFRPKSWEPGFGLLFCGDPITNVRIKEFPGDIKSIENVTRAELCDVALPGCMDVVARRIANETRAPTGLGAEQRALAGVGRSRGSEGNPGPRGQPAGNFGR